MSRKSFFAASNTEEGFVSYFGENLRERAERCYIIKGGPGTGKSRLLRELGEAFEAVGGDVEYYYCSSDPASLDGIYARVNGESIAFLDGTPPHAEELLRPGTVDSLIDLCRFWNANALRERRTELDRLAREKSNAYAAAYRALKAYGCLRRSADELVEECTDIDAIAQETAKLALNLPREALLRTPISAFGMRGFVSLNTFREAGRPELTVTDSRGYGISYLYLGQLIKACGGGRAAPHPILCGRWCGLLTGGASITEAAFTDTGDGAVDSSDFVDRSAYLNVKSRVESLRRLADGALEEADLALRKAGEAHMRIEEIFISAMDFAAKEEYSLELCAKIARGDL